MIIKTKICAGGNRSLTRFPIPRFTMEECLTADGKRLDKSRAMLAFTGEPACFQISDRDNERTLWASLTFCELMQGAFGRCVANAGCDVNDHAVTKQDEKIVERIDRKCAWVRQTVSPSADGVNVKIRVDNPFELIGQTVEEATNFAVTCCQLWQRIIEQTKVMKVTVETNYVIWNWATDNNRKADIRAEYVACTNRNGCYCSPVQPKCPCYRDGKCIYEEIVK